jgi:hypothetical protein
VATYFIIAMRANIVVSVALAALLSTVYCALGCAEVISHDYDVRCRNAHAPCSRAHPRTPRRLTRAPAVAAAAARQSRWLLAWLAFLACAGVGWSLSLAEVVNAFGFGNADATLGATVGTISACVILLLHFKFRALAALLCACCGCCCGVPRAPQPPQAAARSSHAAVQMPVAGAPEAEPAVTVQMPVATHAAAHGDRTAELPV